MERYLKKAIEHARLVYPQEACGLVVIRRGFKRYVPTENSAKKPTKDFRISETEYWRASALGEVCEVVHSHPDADAYLSPQDSLMHKASGEAWTVIGLPDGPEGEATVLHVEAAGPQPLIGRIFLHAINDCYSLIRDFYQQERSVTLPDFEREDQWWLKGYDLYEQNFRLAGFMPVETPEDGDVILMQIRSPVPNHAGIYLNGDLLHHQPGRLSGRDCYGSYYRECTRRYLRYCGPA